MEPHGEREQVKWPDGTKMVRIYPPGTTVEMIDSTEPISERWFDPDGSETSPKPRDRYPLPPWRPLPPHW